MLAFGIVLTALFFIIGGAAYTIFRLAFYSPNKVPDNVYALPPGRQHAAFAEEITERITQLLSVPFEQVYTTAHDGVRLAARYYHRRDGAPIQIQFHGYRGNALREYAGTFEMSEMLGVNTLVVDMRGHGASGGHVITLGVLERLDCLTWIDYANRRFGKHVPIVLTGASMGAATVLMASGLELPSNVAAIIADSPFSSPYGIIKKVCRMARIPVWVGCPLAAIAAVLFGGFRLGSTSALEAVAANHIPLLLIHGDDDHFVPNSMSKELSERSLGPCKLFAVPGAGHCLSYFADRAGYYNQLRDFLCKYMIINR